MSSTMTAKHFNTLINSPTYNVHNILSRMLKGSSSWPSLLVVKNTFPPLEFLDQNWSNFERGLPSPTGSQLVRRYKIPGEEKVLRQEVALSQNTWDEKLYSGVRNKALGQGKNLLPSSCLTAEPCCCSHHFLCAVHEIATAHTSSELCEGIPVHAYMEQGIDNGSSGTQCILSIKWQREDMLDEVWATLD